MNEEQLIRRQLAIERQHLRELAALCGHAQDTLLYYKSMRYMDYMRYHLPREHARGAAHIDRMRKRAPLTLAESTALADLQQALTDTGLAQRSCSPGDPPRDAALLCRLVDALERIEALAEPRYTIEDWRSVARIDADSVLQERRLWAEVLRHGPLAAAR
jgi:hypothetical protein